MTREQKWLLALGAVAAALAGGGGAVLIATRGERNNNPGNLIRTGIGWRGEVPDDQKTDDTFEQFTHPLWGLRALALDLLASVRRGQTLAELIGEYAPVGTNDTAAYLANVSRWTGIAPTTRPTRADVRRLVDAVVLQENGRNRYPPELVDEAVSMALSA